MRVLVGIAHVKPWGDWELSVSRGLEEYGCRRRRRMWKGCRGVQELAHIYLDKDFGGKEVKQLNKAEQIFVLKDHCSCSVKNGDRRAGMGSGSPVRRLLWDPEVMGSGLKEVGA